MPAVDAPLDLPGFTPAPPLPDVLDTPIADEMPPLPGFTADSMAGQPDLESYPIQDHDSSDHVKSFPIGEEAGPLVLESVDMPAAQLLESIASGHLPPQNQMRNFQHEFDEHKGDRGLDGSFRATAPDFAQALIAHKSSSETELSFGTYRGTIPVIHFYNRETGHWLTESLLVDSTDIFPWVLTDQQEYHLDRTGNVQ